VGDVFAIQGGAARGRKGGTPDHRYLDKREGKEKKDYPALLAFYQRNGDRTTLGDTWTRPKREDHFFEMHVLPSWRGKQKNCDCDLPGGRK